MKATDELKKEHQGIELMLQILRAISKKLSRGENVPVEHLESIIEFFTVFVDKCHHGKEEEFLFSALETAGVLREGGPIGVMLSEHEQGRKLVAKLKDALMDYRTVDKTAAISIQVTCDKYITLRTSVRNMAKDRRRNKRHLRLLNSAVYGTHFFKRNIALK